MSFLVPVVCMALLVGFLAAIVYPILTTRHAWRRATGGDRAHFELTERKEQVLASIRELEFDHSLGKMDVEDYESLRGDLEAEAIEVLRRIDALDGHADPARISDLDARIEADIAAQRAASVIRPAAAVTPAAHAFCHQCGKPRTAEYRFCPHCGQALADAATN